MPGNDASRAACYPCRIFASGFIFRHPHLHACEKATVSQVQLAGNRWCRGAACGTARLHDRQDGFLAKLFAKFHSNRMAMTDLVSTCLWTRALGLFVVAAFRDEHPIGPRSIHRCRRELSPAAIQQR